MAGPGAPGRMIAPGRRRRFVEEVSGEEYVHKAVWQVVLRQFAHAEAHPRGAMYDYLVAMLFASHALEGYANYLGEKVAPDLWMDERERFRATGVAGKLAALHECCGLEVPAKGRRPMSTIRELKRLRDGIAHPRMRVTTTTTPFVESREPPLFARSWLGTAVTAARARRAKEDVEAIVARLHAATLARFPMARLGPDSLDGIMAMRSSSITLVGLHALSRQSEGVCVHPVPVGAVRQQ